MKKLIATAAIATAFAGPSIAAVSPSAFAALQQQVSATCLLNLVECPTTLSSAVNTIVQGGGDAALTDAQINALLIRVSGSAAGSSANPAARAQLGNAAANAASMVSDARARDSARAFAEIIAEGDIIDPAVVAQTGSSN